MEPVSEDMCSPVSVLLRIDEFDRNRSQFLQALAIEWSRWRPLFCPVGKLKGEDYLVAGVSALVPDEYGQAELSPLAQRKARTG